jgi:ABC-type nitrate/sulfonate/bicarbonate transport system substrate-binding protein
MVTGPTPLKFKGFLFIILFVCLCVSCHENGVDNRKKPIRFALQNRIGSAIPMVALEKGFFEKHGLFVKPFRFSNGPACAEALYSGSADIATMGDATAILATVQHPRLKIMASHCTGEHRHRLIVRNNAPYSSMEELRGKRIGIKKGTSTHGGLLSALSVLNIPESAMTFVDLNPGIMPEALMAGSIDAFAASEPTPSIAEVKGGRELMTFGKLGNQYPILLVVHQPFLDNRRNDLLRFLHALREAEIFIRENSAETADILAKKTGLPLDVTHRAMARHFFRLRFDKEISSSLSSTAAFLLKQKIIANLPDLLMVAPTDPSKLESGKE